MIDTVNCGLPIPSVSGALHWLAHIQGEENQVILSFHVNNESFKELATPDSSLNESKRFKCVMLFKGKLAFMEHGRVAAGPTSYGWLNLGIDFL